MANREIWLRRSDLAGKELKIVSLDFDPVFKVGDFETQTGFAGFSHELLLILSGKLNFRFRFFPPEDYLWGNVIDANTVNSA